MCEWYRSVFSTSDFPISSLCSLIPQRSQKEREIPKIYNRWGLIANFYAPGVWRVWGGAAYYERANIMEWREDIWRSQNDMENKLHPAWAMTMLSSLSGPLYFGSKCRKHVYRVYHHTRDCTIPACKLHFHMTVFVFGGGVHHQHPVRKAFTDRNLLSSSSQTTKDVRGFSLG